MITGVHTIIYSKHAEAVRSFFHEILERPSIDAGGGWPIFKLPPAELGVHPGESESHELFLMCDDLEATLAWLKTKGVDAAPVQDQGWGLLTSITIPNGPTLGLYEPKHPVAHSLSEPRADAKPT